MFLWRSQPKHTSGTRRRVLDAASLGLRIAEPVRKPRLLGGPDTLVPHLLLGLLSILMLYLPNQAQFQMETGLRGLNVVNILFILALAVLLLMPRDTGKPAVPTPLKLPIILFFLLLAWALVVALLGDASAWVEDVTVFKNAVFYVLLYFLFFHAVRDMKSARWYAFLLLFVVLTSGVLGVRQALDYGLGQFNDQKRVAAPFGWSVFDANRSAIFFCIYLQLVLAVILFFKTSTWLRVACIIIFLLGVFSILHTYSRQSYIILAVLILLLALRKHVLTALVVVFALYHYDAWVPETVVERIEMTQIDPFEVKRYRPQSPAFGSPTTSHAPLYGEVVNFRSSNPFSPARSVSGESEDAAPEYDGSTESRFTLWAGAWELMIRNPLGIVLNRFKRDINPYVPVTMAGKDAHNYLVLVTTEAGFVAPLVMLALLGALMLQGLRLSHLAIDDESRTLGAGFVMATWAVILGNVFGSRFVDGDVMGLYWIFAALVTRVGLFKREEALARQLKRSAASAAGCPSVPIAQRHVATAPTAVRTWF